jgi:integrase
VSSNRCTRSRPPTVRHRPESGVRYIRVHDTRRTCAAFLVALDVHPRVAMQMLRHSQIAMTMEIYSEVPTAKTRSALKWLGRQLDG